VSGGPPARRSVDLGFPGVRLTETSLEILDPGLSFEDWDAVGFALSRIRDSMGFALGDWLLFGEAAYGERYTQAAAITRRSYSGLANLRYVSRHVVRSRRREELSWSHHAAVASLEPDEQVEWLDRAEEGGWSVDLLASMLRDAREFSPRGEKSEAEVVEAPSEPEPDQLVLGRPSLAELVEEIVAAPADEHGRTCIGSNMRERRRAALAEAEEPS